MGHLNSLVQEHIFIYSYASYKSDQKENNEWTTWPFQAIILSGMDGGENRVVSESYQWLVLLEEMLHVQCQAHLFA